MGTFLGVLDVSLCAYDAQIVSFKWSNGTPNWLWEGRRGRNRQKRDTHFFVTYGGPNRPFWCLGFRALKNLLQSGLRVSFRPGRGPSPVPGDRWAIIIIITLIIITIMIVNHHRQYDHDHLHHGEIMNRTITTLFRLSVPQPTTRPCSATSNKAGGVIMFNNV